MKNVHPRKKRSVNAGTVGEAFRYSARYFRIINTAISLPIDESGNPVTFAIVDESGPMGVTRPYAEYCFAAFVLHVRAATGVDFPLRRITFVHRAPPDVTEHERVFDCPVHFEAEHNRLYIDRLDWQTPTTGAHPGVLKVLAEHADLLLQKLPRGPDLVERTRRAIGERLRGGDSSLENVARELATSARSLQALDRLHACSITIVASRSRRRRCPTSASRSSATAPDPSDGC